MVVPTLLMGAVRKTTGHVPDEVDGVIKPDFQPFFTGTLLQLDAVNVPPRRFYVQPYGWAPIEYGQYANSYKLQNATDIYTFIPFVQLETGIFSWLDVTAYIQAQYFNVSGYSAFSFGDFSIAPGFQILLEDRYTAQPDLRLYIQQTIPTGKYQNLAEITERSQATGAGTYQTLIAIVMQKTFYNIPYHPYELNLNLGYTYQTKTRVSNRNFYGGGEGTDGVVDPGNSYLVNLSGEIAFDPTYAFALDINFVYQNTTTFKGNPGVTPTGEVATVGGPPSLTLSLAPAFEVMFDANSGVIFGVWFSVLGHNNTAYATPTLSYTYLF
ncbi:MAG: hypothetical protein S4CHLAM102_14010 [Chlamydiia bacterium]|nr:hypothetical protein [Chlamydiia bacterium]